MTPNFLSMMGLSPSGINPHKDTLTLYDYEELEFYEKEYEKNIPRLTHRAPQKIPKNIHFIWVGPNPFPEESIRNVLSWKEHNPDWKFYFWTDQKDRKCPIDHMEKIVIDFYDFSPLTDLIKSTPYPAEKADLIRYIALYDMGGFYADHDATCLCPFEPLLQFDFVAGFEYPHWHGGLDSALVFANGLFGSTKGHKALANAMQHALRLWVELEKYFPDEDNDTPRWKIIRRSFDSFSLGIKQALHDKQIQNALFLPSCYFFPDIILTDTDITHFEKLGLVMARHGYTKLW